MCLAPQASQGQRAAGALFGQRGFRSLQTTPDETVPAPLGDRAASAAAPSLVVSCHGLNQKPSCLSFGQNTQTRFFLRHSGTLREREVKATSKCMARALCSSLWPQSQLFRFCALRGWQGWGRRQGGRSPRRTPEKGHGQDAVRKQPRWGCRSCSVLFPRLTGDTLVFTVCAATFARADFQFKQCILG